MRLAGLCGLSVAGVLASCALGASPLAAAAPEFRICGRAAKVRGKYLGSYRDSACADPASQAEQAAGMDNTYERRPWTPATRAHSRGRSSVPAKANLVNPLGGGGGAGEPATVEASLECGAERVQGDVIASTRERLKTTYTGCRLGAFGACNSAGAKPGVIASDPLEGTLVYLDGAHQRVGMSIHGLGPTGRLWQYQCLGNLLAVEVYGGLLVERRGDIDTSARSFETVAREGPLHLQADLYPEEAFSEEQGKATFEWGFGFARCVQQAIGEGVPETEAALGCLAKSGSPPAPPPIALLGIASGLQSGPVPEVLDTATVSRAPKTLLVEAR